MALLTILSVKMQQSETAFALGKESAKTENAGNCRTRERKARLIPIRVSSGTSIPAIAR